MKIRLYNDEYSLEQILPKDFIKDNLLWKEPEFNCLISDITSDHPFIYGYLEGFAFSLDWLEFTHIQFIKKPDIYSALFTALEQSCLDEGGDGDSIYLGQDYIRMADRFQDWLTINNNSWWKKEILDDYIAFSNDQECIWFTNNPETCPWDCTTLQFGWNSKRNLE